MRGGAGVTILGGTVVRGKLITVNTDAFDFCSEFILTNMYDDSMSETN